MSSSSPFDGLSDCPGIDEEFSFFLLVLLRRLLVLSLSCLGASTFLKFLFRFLHFSSSCFSLPHLSSFFNINFRFFKALSSVTSLTYTFYSTASTMMNPKNM